MTIEEITSIVNVEGIDRVNAALQSLGYRAFKVTPTPTVPEESRSVGSIQLLDVGGNSVPAHEITVEPIISSLSVNLNGIEAYPNLLFKPFTVFTDEEGIARISLVKGSKVRVYVSNSSIYREVLVPDQDFSLISPEVATDADSFSSPVIAPVLSARGDI